MTSICYYCGGRFSGSQALYAHWRKCGIYRAVKMGYLPLNFSLYEKCPWFKDGVNPYTEEEKAIIGMGAPPSPWD